MNTWHQLVVTGNEKALRGFVAGFTAACGRQEEIHFGSDLKIAPTSLAERVRGLLVPAASHHLVYAASATAAALVQAFGARGKEVGLDCISQCEVVGASFSYTLETFSPEVAEMVKEHFLHVPGEGVERVNAQESETHHPESEGAELYAPDHSFEFRAGGTIRGPFPGVVELYRRARGFEHIALSPLTVDTRQG